MNSHVYFFASNLSLKLLIFKFKSKNYVIFYVIFDFI